MTFILNLYFIFVFLLIKDRCATDIDLSRIIKSVENELNTLYITFKINPEDRDLQIICAQCKTHTNGPYITCKEKDFVKVTLEVNKNNLRLKVPFNITCGDINPDIIRDFEGRSKDISVELSWKTSSEKTNNYIVYYFDNNNYHYNIITTKKASYILKDLKERTKYQICVATINHDHATGPYTCIKKVTDFTETGPVVNIIINSFSDHAIVSWSKPSYNEDNPEGYVVTYYEYGGGCTAIIINMRNIIINSKIKCSKEEHVTWDTLGKLTIRNLRPYTDYIIVINPINGNRKQKETSTTFKTEEGESGPVSNIKWMEKNDWFYLSFVKPNQENGIVRKYKVKVVLLRLGICKRKNETVYSTSTLDINYEYIMLDVMKKCAEYLIEVSPINGWRDNGGVGRKAHIIFKYKPKSPPLIYNYEAKFISSNVARISWAQYLNNEECAEISYMAEVRSEIEKSKCFKMIISNESCEDFPSITETYSKCVVKEVKSQIIGSSRVVYVDDEFKSGNYEMTLWKITDSSSIEKKSLVVPNIIKDCFTDCYNSAYNGIRSAKDCVKWKDSKYKQHSSANNLCIKESTYTWCSTKNHWKKCNIKECSEITTYSGCVNDVYNIISTNKSTIRWSPPLYQRSLIGYLTLLYNLDECEQSHIQMCDHCSLEDLDQQIKDFYIFCKKTLSSRGIFNETIFNNLHQNKEYIVFIIPLITRSQPGEVKKTSLRTLLAVPDSVRNIKTTHKTTSSLSFSWDKLKESDNNGLPDYYEASLNETLPKKKCYNESVEFLDLRMCTEYCLRVYGRNKAGESRNSESSCHYTLAPNLGLVKVNDIKSGPSSQRVIPWTYSSNDHCDKSYKVKYKEKFKEYDMLDDDIYEDTKNNRIMIKNLEKNNIYVVQVRPETNLETKNNKKYGEYSKEVEFYTGEVNPSIYEYKEEVHPSRQRMNISWRVNASYEGSIFQFIVVIKNSSKECLKSINLICSTCPDPYKLKNLNHKEKEKRNNYLKCNNNNSKEYVKDNLTINYTSTFNEPLKNFSIQIYAINLMGVHKVHDHNSLYKEESKGSIGTILLCILSLLIIVIIIMAVIYKLKHKKLPKYTNISKPHTLRVESQNKTTNNDAVKDIQLQNTNSIAKDTNVVAMTPKRETRKLKPTATKETDPTLKPKSSNDGIALNEFHKYYNRMNKNDSVLMIEEYKKLSIQSKNMEKTLGLTLNIGKSSENAKKNRFVNILPFDQTRVILEGRSANNDYINANYIPFISQEDKHEYIASQGPIEHNINDFWQMISTQNINCIVMLTRTMEEGKFKCLQYWPEKIGEQITFGDKWKITVKMINETDSESHFERLLIMKDEKSMEERRIVHLHMHTWFDHSAPNLEYFDKLLFRFHELANDTATNPYLIHCSAGVGRTGTLICIDRIIKQLVAGYKLINIYDTVFNLRHYRKLLVQRQAQYVFIHDYINHFLKKYMKMDDGDEMLYFNEN